MKNIYKKFCFTISLLLVFGACDDIETIVLNSEAYTTVNLSVNSLILTDDISEDEVLNISWSEPSFGFNAAPTYKILMDVEGNNFSNPQIIPTGTDLNKLFTAKKLNDMFLSMELIPFEIVNIEVKVLVHLSDFEETMSDAVTLTVTPYSSVLDLSTNWGIVGSAVNDWGATPDLPFYKTDEVGVLVSYVTLIDGEIKFRENNDWTINYGDTGADGSLEINGDNIVVSEGTYKIIFDLNLLTYSIEPMSWGIVGSAFNEWGATPDALFAYDSFSDQWRIIVTLLDGEMKFRLNNDWAVNYGDTGNDGTFEINGDNISVTAGNYIISINFNDSTYTIEPIDNIWGLVGSAYNEWGATPDAIFTRDWSITDDVWVLKGVTLLDGEYKFRANSDWGINYGDTGSDGTLEINGDNIISIAGVYNITLDFSDSDNPTYSIE